MENILNIKPTIQLDKDKHDKYYEEKKSPIHNPIKAYQLENISKQHNQDKNDKKLNGNIPNYLPNINLADILDKKSGKKVDKNDYYSVEK